MVQAMIDIGSSTIRMAVYRIEGGKVEQVMKRKHRAGLAAHISGETMDDEGVALTVKIVREYKSLLDGLGVGRVTAFTTAALRNAVNSREAVAAIEEGAGVSIRVLSGEEEAHFGFVGATHGLSSEDGVLLDIGGASTEVVRYEAKEPVEKLSLPIGALALRTRYMSSVLPSRAELDAMKEAVERCAAAAHVAGMAEAGTVCGIGGTLKSGLALYGLAYGEPRGSSRMKVQRIAELIRRFTVEGPPAEEDALLLLRAAPDRAETLIPGLAIAVSLARRMGCDEMVYRDSGVREGMIYGEILKDIAH